jgi:adenosine deaminase
MELQVLRSLPKVELHVHLEGIISHQAFLKLRRANAVDIPQKYHSEYPAYFPTFPDFVEAYYAICHSIRKEQDFRTVTGDLADYLHADNIQYAEVSFTPFFYIRQGMSFSRIMGIVNEELERLGLRDRVFFIIDSQRDHEAAIADKVFREAFQLADMNICGIGLTGAEVPVPASEFRPFFLEARDAYGLGLTAHAGEFGPPAMVRDSIEVMEVSRIGHGIRAVEDEELMDFVLSRNVHFEICPTSNVKLHRVANYAAHPVGKFLERGMNVGINSDDPGIFRTSLSNEYEIVMETFDLPLTTIGQTILQAIDTAFTTDEHKKSLRTQVQAALAGAGLDSLT